MNTVHAYCDGGRSVCKEAQIFESGDGRSNEHFPMSSHHIHHVLPVTRSPAGSNGWSVGAAMILLSSIPLVGSACPLTANEGSQGIFERVPK
jgi:hypothetical protein